jgi:hypothetical protein
MPNLRWLVEMISSWFLTWMVKERVQSGTKYQVGAIVEVPRN